jgi:hypothetical protein
MATALSVSAAAQNFSVVATVDGCCDITARIEKYDRPYLVLPVYETALTVLEMGDDTMWWWSYIVPPIGIFRDGVVERVSALQPAVLRLPLDIIPPGVYRWRIGTVHGYTDTLTLTTY